MALMNKILAYTKKTPAKPTADSQRWNGFQFADHQVRVILFRECDSQSRKLLFDSSAVKKIESYPKEKNNNASEINLEHKIADLSSARSSKSDLPFCIGEQTYQFHRPNPDISNLGEMIFGSVALTFRGTCLKVHSIPGTEETSKRIMCTHVFWSSPLKPNLTRRPQNSSAVSSTSDLSTTSFKNSQSGSLDVPRFEYEKDSGFGFGDHSAGSSFSNEGMNSFLSSDQALHDNQFYYPFSPVTNRQVFRNLTTSLDFWPPSNRSSMSEPQSFSDNDSRRNSTANDTDFIKKFKLGLAILIDLNKSHEKEVEIFLMEHMPLLDTVMWRLRDCVHRAVYRKQLFIPIMLDGSKEAITSFRLLFQPSIPSPIWINNLKVTEPSADNLFYKLFLNVEKRETDVEKFIREFCELLKSLDCKDTNFFISSLITAVLSHHLGWILSMADRSSTQSHLCSALWTQLSEMCGAIGTPARSAQTVIVGKTETNIEPILNIVSYFTRYNTIDRRKEIQMLEPEVTKPPRLNPIVVESNLEKSFEMTEFKSQCSKDSSNLEETEFVNDCDMTLKRTKTENLLNVSECEKEMHLPESKVLFEIGEDEPLVIVKEKSPEPSCSEKQRSPCHLRVKKYSGVKFNFEQYPQIATNYMKSKNLEMSNIPFLKKTMNDLPNFGEFSNFPENSDQCECGMDECDEVVLQTPSNASELESTTDIIPEKKEFAIEKVHEATEIRRFDRQKLENTIIINPDSKNSCTKHTVIKQNGIKGKKSLKRTEKHPLENCDIKIDIQNPKIIQLKLQTFPLSKSSEILVKSTFPPAGYEYSLLRTGTIQTQYMPGVVLQAITEPMTEWVCALRRDLILAVHHSPMDQPISEAVCIVADVDNWRVQIISSSGTSLNSLSGIHNSGVSVYASQLVGDMLESLLELWKLRVAPHECLRHLEEKLFEIYMRSFGFTELLLSTDFCDMSYLTKTLNLHPNDVPLLLAIASTHTPQVVRKYGVSYPI